MKDLKIDLKKMVSGSKHLDEGSKDCAEGKSSDEKKIKFTNSFEASGIKLPAPTAGK